MKQGTTPTIEFKLDIEISNVTEVIFTFTDELAYKGTSDDETTNYLLQKNYPDDATFEDDVFKLPLTQEETDLLTNTFYVEAQVICDKAVVKSDVKKINMPHTLWTTYVDDNESDGNSEVIHLSFSDYVRVEGGGTTDDYNDLSNKPKINNVELKGNKTSEQLGLENPISAGDGLKREDNTISVDVDANSILEFNNHKLSADTSGLQPTISGGNGIDVSSDVVSVDLASGSGLQFSGGKLEADLFTLGTNTLRQTLTLDNYLYPLASKSYVDSLISGRLRREITTILPTEDIDTNTIYMLFKGQSATSGNIYDEYMYINNSWELIGNTEVDLSNYYTKSETYTKTETVTEINNRSSKVYSAVIRDGEISKLASDYPNIKTNDLIERSSSSSSSRLYRVQGVIQNTRIEISQCSVLHYCSGIPNTTISVTTGVQYDVDNIIISDNGNLYRVLTKDITDLPDITYTYQTYDGHNTTYTGGDGIDITNDTISVDIASGSALQITSGELDVDLSSIRQVPTSAQADSGKLLSVNSSGNAEWQTKNYEDKTTITTDTSSTTPTLTLADNNEYRYTTDLTSLTLTMPSGNFIASVVFSSGSTPTSMTYDSSIKWSGNDVTSNAFVPVANQEYEIVFWYNGLSVNAVVRGVA